MGRKNIDYKGKTYNSLKDLTNELGKSYTLIATRLHNNWTLEQAIEIPSGESIYGDTVGSKKMEYRGKAYKSIAELARETGVKLTTLKARLKRGLSVEEAVEKNR